MPNPLLIQGGLNAASGILGAIGTMWNNRQERRFAQSMYDQQVENAWKFWDAQNAYNDPSAQMARYKAAGLNPHLVSSGGNPGNASAPSAPSPQSVHFQDPQFGAVLKTDAIGTLATMVNIEKQKAETDNVKAQNDLIKQDVAYRALQAKRAGFDLGLAQDLRESNVSFRKEEVRKLQAEIDMSMDENARRAAQNASNLQEAVSRMAFMKEQQLTQRQERARSRAEVNRINDERIRIRESVSLLQKEGVLKDIEIALRRNNINPNDPMWQRYVGMILGRLFDNFGDIPQESNFNSSPGFPVGPKY